MNDDEIWAATDAQRLGTADLLESLNDAEWSRPSLCEGWTVRDVAAHLSLQPIGLRRGLWMGLRYPGGMNHVINRSARGRARRPVDQIITDLRSSVGTHRPNFGLTATHALLDALVHSQDIAIPLGRELPMASDAAAAAATHAWSTRGTVQARVFRRLPLEGLRLEATDTDWAVGEGAPVEGPVAALLLLLTGRRVALAQLSGPGADLMREREAASPGPT